MYPTRQRNIDSLESVGFTPSIYTDDYGVEHTTWESPGSDWTGPIVSAHVYLSAAGYDCVAINEFDWRAPIVTADDVNEFISWLDKHYPGWK